MHAPQPNQVLDQLPTVTADVLMRLRTASPRVHCITNAVAQNFTANVLLAVGAVPAMTFSPEEVGEFVAAADALLVNLGTLDRERRDASEIAIQTAVRAGRPWVLDPVFVERSPRRAAFAKTLAMCAPAAVRLNSAEFGALTDTRSGKDALMRYAQERGCVMALTGQTDILTDGRRTVQIANGDALMGRVTAMGCAGAALVAAALAVERDALLAVAAALTAFAVAGEVAALRARGPGTFAVEFIDALAGLDRETLQLRARLA